jgi:hypothetical protein
MLQCSKCGQSRGSHVAVTWQSRGSHLARPVAFPSFIEDSSANHCISTSTAPVAHHLCLATVEAGRRAVRRPNEQGRTILPRETGETGVRPSLVSLEQRALPESQAFCVPLQYHSICVHVKIRRTSDVQTSRPASCNLTQGSYFYQKTTP